MSEVIETPVESTLEAWEVERDERYSWKSLNIFSIMKLKFNIIISSSNGRR